MIRAIYFDLDNTLIDRNASIEKFSESLIFHFEENLDAVSPFCVSEIIKTHDNGGYLASNSKYNKIYEAIGSELAVQLPWKDTVTADDITKYWRSEFPKNSVEMNGAANLVKNLFGQGYHIGLISNGSESSRQSSLRATSFSNQFKQVVSSEKFGINKPSASIFVQTAKDAGFKAEECVFIGDHPVNDISGALGAGMRAILLSGFHNDLPVPQGTIVIHHLADVIDVFSRFE